MIALRTITVRRLRRRKNEIHSQPRQDLDSYSDPARADCDDKDVPDIQARYLHRVEGPVDALGDVCEVRPNTTKPVRNTTLSIAEYDKIRSEAMTSNHLLRVLDFHFHGTNEKKGPHFKMDKKCKLEAECGLRPTPARPLRRSHGGIHEDLHLEQGLEKWRAGKKEAKK